ncbi:MAG: MMPL family transporter, partial [Mycobacteriaceae bacterium]
MASYLYQLGKFCFRRKWIVGGTALLLLLLMITAAATMARPTSDAFSIPGIPSEQAMHLMDERFPADAQALSPDAATAKFVMAAPSGQTLTDPRNAAAVQQVIDKVKALPQLSPGLAEEIRNPVVTAQATLQAADANAALPVAQRNPAIPTPENVAALLPLNMEPVGRFPAQAVAFTSVTFGTPTQTAHDVTDSTRDAIEAAAQTGRDAGLTVYATGSAVQPAGGSNAGELVGIGVAAVVLAITFGALVAAGLPLLTALIGVAIGSLGITAATGIWELSSATPTLATMIGLAVAIDYA